MRFIDEVLMTTDEEYREIDAFSYSSLKLMDDEGPLSLLYKEKKSSPALEFGSLVDILITDPDSQYTKFHTKTLDKPTASTLVLADELVKDHLLLDVSVDRLLSDEYVISKIRNLKLWSSMVDEDKLKSKYDNKQFKEYVTESIASNGKIIVTEEVLNSATECAKVLTAHPYTSKLFDETDTIEVIKQPSVVYQHNGVVGKARIDLLRIDHEKKLIDIMDIKTGSELPTRFINSFYRFKYYLQVISYIGAIMYILNKSKYFNDYNINSFQFLYLSKKMPLVPTIHTVPDTLLPKFMNGWFSGNGEYNKGFKELVEEYKYYKETNTFSVEREVILNDGKFKISLL